MMFSKRLCDSSSLLKLTNETNITLLYMKKRAIQLLFHGEIHNIKNGFATTQKFKRIEIWMLNKAFVTSVRV